MSDVRATGKLRSSRIGLKPLAGPLTESYWIIKGSTTLLDEKQYRVVIVTSTERKYGRAGHQQAFVEFVPAKFTDKHAQTLMKYTLDYDSFIRTFRKLEGEEFADEMALILLANV